MPRMPCVAKKIPTIPFGGEIPPQLSEAFDALNGERGWIKRRALAAAVRAFLLMPEEVQEAHYRDAYELDAVTDRSATRPEASEQTLAEQAGVRPRKARGSKRG